MKDAKKVMNVALMVFIDHSNKVMLNRRADASSEMWEFIGGTIEANETPKDAIIREIFEEVGYKMRETHDELEFIEQFKYDSDRLYADVHVFKAKYPGVENFSDSDETFVQDLKLFNLDEAERLTLLPMSKLVLERNLLK